MKKAKVKKARKGKIFVENLFHTEHEASGDPHYIIMYGGLFGLTIL